MAGLRKPKTDLDDSGRQVFRYDKGPENDPQPRYATAREGSTKYQLLDNTAGWYRVDATEREDSEAAKAAREDALAARDEENARLDRRSRSTMGTETATASRGRGRPSNAEKAAKAEADALREQNAELTSRVEALMAKLDSANTGTTGKAEGTS